MIMKETLHFQLLQRSGACVSLCHKLRQDDDDTDYNEEKEDVYKCLQMSQNCQATTKTMMCVFMSQPPEAK